MFAGRSTWTLGDRSSEFTMHIAILTFDGFNEIDSLIALTARGAASAAGCLSRAGAGFQHA